MNPVNMCANKIMGRPPVNFLNNERETLVVGVVVGVVVVVVVVVRGECGGDGGRRSSRRKRIESIVTPVSLDKEANIEHHRLRLVQTTCPI